jgi:hypothetical protein
MFLLSDGSVVDRADETRANFYNLPEGDYYLVIHHRNHLPIMSKFPVSFVESGSSSVDLTVKDNIYGEADAVKELEPGTYGMYAGDINQDGEITPMDMGIWLDSYIAGDSEYEVSDVNLNGEVMPTDSGIWYDNYQIGASSQVP